MRTSGDYTTATSTFVGSLYAYIFIPLSIQHEQLYLRWERNRVSRLRLALFRGGKQSGSDAAPYPQENGTAERRTNLPRGRTHRPSGIPEHRGRPTTGQIQRGRLAGSAGPRSVPAVPHLLRFFGQRELGMLLADSEQIV
jgi:hypothetical protein